MALARDAVLAEIVGNCPVRARIVPPHGSVTKKENTMMSSWMKRFLASTILASSLVVALPAHAAVSIVLKLTDIKGESIASKHVGEIDTLSWSWGVTRETPQGSGARGIAVASAKASPSALVIMKYVDAASPSMFLAAIQGKRIAEATLVVMKVGGKTPVDMIKIKLKDVVITSVKTGNPTPNDRYTEEVSLAFASAEYSYTGQNADQTAGATVTVNW
jgi:type VI secretion system secreted protein Hcp